MNIQLNYTKDSVISATDGASTFKITKTELYVPAVTLNTEDNNKSNQLLEGEFKRTVYWNEYKRKIETIGKLRDDNNYKRTLLDAEIPGVNRLFVMGFNDVNNGRNRVQRDSHKNISYRELILKIITF